MSPRNSFGHAQAGVGAASSKLPRPICSLGSALTQMHGRITARLRGTERLHRLSPGHLLQPTLAQVAKELGLAGSLSEPAPCEDLATSASAAHGCSGPAG
eukprot:8793474-Alexandrium_andersonii.AAC.1